MSSRYVFDTQKYFEVILFCRNLAPDNNIERYNQLTPNYQP